MKQTDNAALIVEGEFARLTLEAYEALNRLGDFWTKLYGPNEALAPATDALKAMQDEFFAPAGERLFFTLVVWNRESNLEDTVQAFDDPEKAWVFTDIDA